MERSLAREILFRDHVLPDHFAFDQVSLNDTFEDFRCALPVPSSLWHDGRNGASLADITAFDPQSQNPSFAGKPQFLQSPLEKLPGLGHLFGGGAAAFTMVGAQQNGA